MKNKYKKSIAVLSELLLRRTVDNAKIKLLTDKLSRIENNEKDERR